MVGRLVFVFGLAVYGQEAKVCLADEVHSEKAQKRDKATVVSIFRGIGVDVRWEECAASEFEIRVMSNAPAGARREVLATTRLAPREVFVYADRVQALMVKSHPAVQQIAFAYVIAHELGHAIQGVARHSEEGIMKPRWSGEDLTAMLFHDLRFAEADAVMIRNRLAVFNTRLRLGDSKLRL